MNPSDFFETIYPQGTEFETLRKAYSEREFEKIVEKLGFTFKPGLKILDVGCGSGGIAEELLKEKYKLDVYAIDVYQHEQMQTRKGVKFKKASAEKIPFSSNFFDYVFEHDVLHHVDERSQSREKHLRVLREMKRVAKPNGAIIMVEANRYNPLFYPHMVKMVGEGVFSQAYFKKLATEIFPNVQFKHYEHHFYPAKFKLLFSAYDLLMNKFSPKAFLSYNLAIARKTK
ncbi:MAG: class I SAM-dependent methyltransferase [Candidatus Micrarchaeia archaeon]|jgi:ubiquinone/menaquinone biosynthesis C-methylase UbiE